MCQIMAAKGSRERLGLISISDASSQVTSLDDLIGTTSLRSFKTTATGTSIRGSSSKFRRYDT